MPYLQVLAFDQPHEDGAVLNAIDGRDIQVIRRGQYPSFALRVLHSRRVLGEGRRQHLDPDPAILDISRAVNGVHAALVTFRKDAVMRDGLLRSHGERISGILPLFHASWPDDALFGN